MDNLEKIAVILSFTSIISVIIRGVDNMKKENRKNVGTTIKIYKDKIKINAIDQVLQQMSYAWVVVFLIYAVVLYLMKDIESIKAIEAVKNIGYAKVLFLILCVFAVAQNAFVADTIRNIVSPKLDSLMIGHTVEDIGKVRRHLNKLIILFQWVSVIALAILFYNPSNYMIPVAVILGACAVVVLGCRIYHYLMKDNRNMYIRAKESTYLSLNLLPKASLNNVDGSDYKAYFQVFLANSKPETYDLFEYAFSIEQDGNTVVVYDCVGNVKAMYNSKEVRYIDVKVGKSRVFNTTETSERIQSTVWHKKSNMPVR